MPNPASPFRLRWYRSWPSDPRARDDFEARVGRDYCRIYLHRGGPQAGRWHWTAARAHRSHGTGCEDTAREAAMAAEQAYFGPPLVAVQSPFVAGFDDPSMPA